MKDLTVGTKVRAIALPPYLKTADPMPMLRPPNLIALGEEGIVVACNPSGYWSVRFDRGTFLLEEQYIESISSSGVSDPSESTPTDTESN
ncbi:MAG: DUF3148 domain-containing protein [Cyanobacteriota bacterium]|nr:DUF3148 domain-containing protein [Cyanobacteriota bacterium]